MYLVGEPMFQGNRGETTFLAPAGQTDLCREVLRETNDLKLVRRNLTGEYLAVICGLREMGADFRIILSHPDKVAIDVINICARMGCRFAGFSADFFPPSIAYPRDFSTTVPGTILINEHTKVLSPEKNGWKLIVSPWGEGGRILQATRHAAVPERICGNGKESYAVEDRHLKPLHDAGMKVMLLPPPLFFEIMATGGMWSLSFNDHLDRVACMIQDKENHPHLIVDPGIRGMKTVNRTLSNWIPLTSEETIAAIQERAAEAGVTFHVAPTLRIPYSLNLLQDIAGRVLMTGGEHELSSLIRTIVGPDMVIETHIPIRYFPAWNYAGIRCLVSEAPTPLLVKKD